MILAVDIGNSTVAARLFGGQPSQACTWPTHGTVAWDAVMDFGRQLLDGGITAALSSVVPSETERWRQALAARCGTVLQAGVELPLPLDVDYDTPESLGVDRVLSAAAAAARCGAPVIVAGCGTATTLDVVDARRTFRGGAILCGLSLQRDALARWAEQLPVVPLEPPERAVGRNTVGCLQSGLLLGHAAAIAGLAAQQRAELNLPDAPLIGTGGLAATLAAAAPNLFHAVWPELVLDGLALAAGWRLEDVP